MAKHIDILQLFNDDADTDVAIMTEIGGTDEIKRHMGVNMKNHCWLYCRRYALPKERFGIYYLVKHAEKQLNAMKMQNALQNHQLEDYVSAIGVNFILFTFG